jgi:hypothetical protein
MMFNFTFWQACDRPSIAALFTLFTLPAFISPNISKQANADSLQRGARQLTSHRAVNRTVNRNWPCRNHSYTMPEPYRGHVWNHAGRLPEPCRVVTKVGSDRAGRGGREFTRGFPVNIQGEFAVNYRNSTGELPELYRNSTRELPELYRNSTAPLVEQVRAVGASGCHDLQQAG